MDQVDQVDITGLMATPMPGWETRVKKLVRHELFAVKVCPKVELWRALSADEQKRLSSKLKLVSIYAQYMAAGMVKGTLKYPTDSCSLEQWMAHVLGEGADQSNYALLMWNKFQSEKERTMDLELEIHGLETELAAQRELLEGYGQENKT